jgi:Ca2+-binding EF-hand superfamily protein
MKRNLSDAPLQIVFALFDANQDGNLAATELVTVSNVLGLLIYQVTRLQMHDN